MRMPVPTAIASPILALALLAAVLIAAPPADADELVKITEFPPVQGYLGDRAQDGVWTEKYDDRTYQFYSYSEMDLNYDETLVLDVLSYDYQPIIYLQDNQGRTIDTGTPIPSWIDAGSGRRVYAAHLDYRSVYQGRQFVFLMHTSHYLTADQNGQPVQSAVSDISQGGFYLTGSLCKPKPVPETPQPSGGGVDTSNHDCSCEDPASGRWYDSFLGMCNAPDASTYWCQ